ncbi:hypothetical protein R3P38DRAFT_3212371 [Favolaschia claudopus]|uniref:Uncharacterized protein n=1 Tax=Favolaschia claudopus TaxID=2862362 RepID=A0AAW0AF00_9AGAR
MGSTAPSLDHSLSLKSTPINSAPSSRAAAHPSTLAFQLATLTARPWSSPPASPTQSLAAELLRHPTSRITYGLCSALLQSLSAHSSSVSRLKQSASISYLPLCGFPFACGRRNAHPICAYFLQPLPHLHPLLVSLLRKYIRASIRRALVSASLPSFHSIRSLPRSRVSHHPRAAVTSPSVSQTRSNPMHLPITAPQAARHTSALTLRQYVHPPNRRLQCIATPLSANSAHALNAHRVYPRRARLRDTEGERGVERSNRRNGGREGGRWMRATKKAFFFLRCVGAAVGVARGGFRYLESCVERRGEQRLSAVLVLGAA